MKSNSINFSDGRNTKATAIIRSVLPAGSIYKIYSDKRSGKFSRRLKVEGPNLSNPTALRFAKKINEHFRTHNVDAICEARVNAVLTKFSYASSRYWTPNDIIVYIK